MRESALEAMLKRLERLERQNRRWKILGILAVSIFLLIGAAQVQTAKSVVVEELPN